jgi:hypothetical protein
MKPFQPGRLILIPLLCVGFGVNHTRPFGGPGEKSAAKVYRPIRLAA